MDDKHCKSDAVFLKEYSRLLRDLKRSKLDISGAPPEVQEAALKLHQHAIAVYWKNRKKKRARGRT